MDSPTQETNPAFPSIESERARSPDDSMGTVSPQPTLPEWITDIPEDLDVWIAQRNFTEAVDLYDSFKDFVGQHGITPSLKDIK